MGMKDRGTTASAVGGTAAILGGLTWFLLVPAAELHRRDVLGYDGYNRLLAIPLLFFLVSLLLAPRALGVLGRSVRVGLVAAAVGVALLLAGNVVEFYGVLLQEKPNAYEAAGETDHWVGFRHRLDHLRNRHADAPGRRTGHRCRNAEAPRAADLAVYATGWVAFGVLIRRGGI